MTWAPFSQTHQVTLLLILSNEVCWAQNWFGLQRGFKIVSRFRNFYNIPGANALILL
jgi:hypothetical protein